jgi:hypothetical protein
MLGLVCACSAPGAGTESVAGPSVGYIAQGPGQTPAEAGPDARHAQAAQALAQMLRCAGGQSGRLGCA